MDNNQTQDAQSVTQEAADLLEEYASYVRTVKADDLERHPYLPEIERVASKLRLAIQPTSAEDAVDLKDPLVVHVNMLRGSIAKPSPRAIWHIYQRELLDAMPEEFRPTPDTQAAAIGAEAMRETLLFVRKAIWPFRMRTEETSDAVALIDSTLDELTQPVAAPQAEMADEWSARSEDHAAAANLIREMGSGAEHSDLILACFAQHRPQPEDGTVERSDWFAGDVDSEGNPLVAMRTDKVDALQSAVKAAQALATCCMAVTCFSREELAEMGRATKPTFDAALQPEKTK